MRERERRREQVQDWKDAGVYPYEGDPASESEQAERIVFDVVSGAIAPAISSRNRAGARLTLTLLRDAIRNDPEKLATIIHEVVSLSDEDRDTLTRLLSETTLPAIIKSANLIAKRTKFLAGLEHIIFDPEDSPAVGEPDHHSLSWYIIDRTRLSRRIHDRFRGNGSERGPAGPVGQGDR
jgi:hypothetical protein